MTASKPEKSKTPWDQTAFEKFKATWSSERAAADEKILKELFKLAKDSPLMAEALEWAAQHGIKFFIDRQAVNCGGYYAEGAGVLGLAENMLRNPASAVEVITHEIRHAWQDYHGLCAPDFVIVANNPDFTKHLIRYALAEADGNAFGKLAAHQYKEMQFQNPRILKDEGAYLRESFLGWFSSHWTKKFYGDWASKLYGQNYGLYDGALPVENVEFRSTVPPIGNGINVDNMRDVLQLGVNFSGTENYLAKLAKLQPDILPKQILRPSLAHTFWGAANENQRKLTAELRKVYLRIKTDRKNQPKPHSWP